MSDIEIVEEAPIIDEMTDIIEYDDSAQERLIIPSGDENKVKDEDEESIPDIPDQTKGFSVDENDDIPDDDIRQMLFLFCVNEDIPLHYKQLLGKIIKKEKYKKNEKLFIFNMIGYVWQKAKEAKDEKDQLTRTQKIIIVRRIHKIVFGKFDDY